MRLCPNEILEQNGFLEKEIAPFAKEVIKILQEKYYQRGEKILGKKFL